MIYMLYLCILYVHCVLFCTLYSFSFNDICVVHFIDKINVTAQSRNNAIVL